MQKTHPFFRKIIHTNAKEHLNIVGQCRTKDEQQKRQRLMASALRTSAKVVKREELCHTLHKDSRRALTQACFHEHPERHTHRRVRDHGVPALHLEPIPARPRQIRVESPSMSTRAKQERKFWQKKRRLNVRYIEPNQKSVHANKCPGLDFSITALNFQKF